MRAGCTDPSSLQLIKRTRPMLGLRMRTPAALVGRTQRHEPRVLARRTRDPYMDEAGPRGRGLQGRVELQQGGGNGSERGGLSCSCGTSRHVASRHVASHHVASRRVTSRHVTSHHVASRRVALRRVASRRVTTNVTTTAGFHKRKAVFTLKKT